MGKFRNAILISVFTIWQVDYLRCTVLTKKCVYIPDKTPFVISLSERSFTEMAIVVASAL